MAGPVHSVEAAKFVQPFTLVVPTRDNPSICRQVLDALHTQTVPLDGSLRVAFLVNDTRPEATSLLQDVLSESQFADLRPALLQASQNWPTVEQNIRHTLGSNLDAVDDHFLIIGNSDHVDLSALQRAMAYLHEHELDLLLVGVLNREVFQGQPVRQLYTTPRHLNPKNRLPAETSYGSDTFAAAVTDYGPVDYLAFIGCQIYTKSFFRRLCAVQDELLEPLYSIPLGTLEATMREPCAVGFWPEVVVTRVDHLQHGPHHPEQAPDWWVVKQRTERGHSNHLLLSVLSSSLQLSPQAFAVLVNAQMVATPRARSQYVFSNFLYTMIAQVCEYVQHGPSHPALRYSAAELNDIVRFGERLGGTEIGLRSEQQRLISRWLQQFGLVGDYSDQARIEALLSVSQTVLGLLEMRPGMERWIAQLS